MKGDTGMSTRTHGSPSFPSPLPRQWGASEILLANENRAVAMKLIYYTVLMVASPIVVFFGLRDFLLVVFPHVSHFQRLGELTLASCCQSVLDIYVVKHANILQDPGRNRPDEECTTCRPVAPSRKTVRLSFDLKNSLMARGMAAVFTTNLVMAAYAIMALREDSGESRTVTPPRTSPLKED